MKEEILNALDGKLDHLNITVDDIVYETEDNVNYLRIVLDRKEIMNVEEVSEAAEIINPIIDQLDPIQEEYVLDIYAKAKGEENE